MTGVQTCALPIWLDGPDTARTIRAGTAVPGPMARVPLVASSAEDNAEQMRRALDAGMDESLPKPYTGDAMAALVRRLLPLAAEHRARLAAADAARA